MCPVCFFEFDGRILQCSQGHAVCEKCSSKLNECPHCRSPYYGTRNYVMEDVIAKLRRLNVETLRIKDEITSAASSLTSATTTTKEAPDNADQPILIEPSTLSDDVSPRRMLSVEDISESTFDAISI